MAYKLIVTEHADELLHLLILKELNEEALDAHMNTGW